jgi:hypothetical protein
MSEEREQFMAVVGMVDVELPGMPPVEREPDVYDHALAVLMQALATVEAAIEEKVELRAQTNAEIKILRDEHDRLSRMRRIAEGK